MDHMVLTFTIHRRQSMNTEDLSPQTRAELMGHYELMCEVALLNTGAINRFQHLPKEQRPAKKKLDGTDITVVEIENTLRTTTRLFARFPKSSYRGEEVPMIEEGADFELGEDPADSTNHILNFEPTKPSVKRWGNHLFTLFYKGTPVAFTAGFPLLGEIYTGNILEGIRLNGKPYTVPSNTTGFIVGLNERDHEDELMEICGYKKVPIAGLCCWLILKGHTLGGINPFPLPHEGGCIAAIVHCAGGTVTTHAGLSFHIPHKKEDGMMWTFDETGREKIMDHVHAAAVH
jgi:hypothetical protein